MLTVFILKSNSGAIQYSIGKYIEELTESLLTNTGVILYLVNYQSNEYKELAIETLSTRFYRISIPTFYRSFSRTNHIENIYASAVVNLLNDFVPRNGEIVFMMNYIDDLPIIKKLKEKYSHPVISVIHNTLGNRLFDGDRQMLNNLINDNPTINLGYTLAREKEMCTVADQIVTVAHCIKEYLVSEHGIESGKIEVINYGLNLPGLNSTSKEKKVAIKKKFGFKQSEKIIMYSGRVGTDKGIYYLLDAFREVCRKSDDTRLVIYGRSDIEVCLKRCDPFFGKITFTGFLHKDLLYELYRIADIGVIPAIYDHCPYTVLEMMAFKIPVIASRINGFDEILGDRNCIIIDHSIDKSGEIFIDKQKISAAILELACNEDKKKELSDQAYKTLIKKFTSTRMVKGMTDLLFKITESEIPVIHI